MANGKVTEGDGKEGQEKGEGEGNGYWGGFTSLALRGIDASSHNHCCLQVAVVLH